MTHCDGVRLGRHGMFWVGFFGWAWVNMLCAQPTTWGVALADRNIPFGLLEPSGSVLVTSNSATVKGYHRFGRPVAVNGVRVTPRVDGRFTQMVPLSMGSNVIYVATTVPTQRDPVVLTRWVYRLPPNGLPSYLLARAGIATPDVTVVTRIEWAKLLWLLVPRSSGVKEPVTRWRDIPDSMSEVVHSAVSQGFMGGVGDRFMPNDPLMQLDVVMMLYRWLGQGVLSNGTNAKNGSEWATRYAPLAAMYGVVKHPQAFQPDAAVTRAALSHLLARIPVRADALMPPAMSGVNNRDVLASTKALVSVSSPMTQNREVGRVATPSSHAVTVALDGHWVKESVLKLLPFGVFSVWSEGTPLVVDRAFVRGPVLRGDLIDILGLVSPDQSVEAKDPMAIASHVFRAPSPTKWALSRRMTKAETITALVRWVGLPCPGVRTGVSNNITEWGHWSAPYVACAVQAGWVSAPSAASSKSLMTRAELLSLLLKIPSISQRVRHASTQP